MHRKKVKKEVGPIYRSSKDEEDLNQKWRRSHQKYNEVEDAKTELHNENWILLQQNLNQININFLYNIVLNTIPYYVMRKKEENTKHPTFVLIETELLHFRLLGRRLSS